MSQRRPRFLGERGTFLIRIGQKLDKPLDRRGRGDFPKDSDTCRLTAQLRDWRAQLEQLAKEFATGDVRVFVAASEDAGGAYAPLTRIAELLALARGAVHEW